MDIAVYVISWPGQHANAAAIARQLGRYRPITTIVFSDSASDVDFDIDCDVIRRPNDLFWTDKFVTCLEGHAAELMLVIHADCMCDDWEDLVSRCVDAYRRYPAMGVWAPCIRGAGYELKHTRLARIDGSSLVVVAQTDAIVFAIPRAIADRMRVANYEGNKYGWGIGWMMVACAYCGNMIAAVDESINVHHATGRGYPAEAASTQMTEFVKQFTLPEKTMLLILQGHIERLRTMTRIRG